MSKVQMFQQVEFFREEHNKDVERYGEKSQQARESFYQFEAAKTVLTAGGLFNEYFEWRHRK